MAHRQSRFAAAFARDVVFFAASRGVEVAALCRNAGVSEQLLETPDELIDGPTSERVWNAAVALTGDDCLGLHLGEAAQPSSLGLLGFAMLSCSHLEEAIGKAVRYWNLLSNATVLELVREGSRASLRMQVLDLPGNFLLHNRHPVECSLCAAISILRGLSGRDVPVIDVTCTYPPPADTREYTRILRQRVLFGSDKNAVTFPAEVLRWPVLHTNVSLMTTFEEQMQRRLAQDKATTRDRVRAEVARRLRGEAPELAAVAGVLGVSERALQRDLQAESTSYREVLDDLRKELAADYLQNPHHTITDVSFLLGFSEPSVLHRYFRRWFQCTPAEYRRNREQLPAQQHAPN